MLIAKSCKLKLLKNKIKKDLNTKKNTMVEIKIPSPGESITEVEISKWLVENGDYVEKDQEIAEIESDKATLPLMAPENGTIEIVVEAGETIQVGAVACKIDTNGVAPSKPKENKKVSKEVKTEKTESTGRTEQVKTGSEYQNVKVSPVAQKLMQENNLSIDDVIGGLKRIGKSEIEQVLLQKTTGVSQTNNTEVSREIERKKM